MADAQEKQDTESPKASKAGIAKWAGLAVGMFLIVTLSQAVAPIITAPIVAKLNAPKEEHGEDGGHEAEEEEKLADPIYAPLNPAMVVNFANDPSGFMQVEVQVMARDQHVIDVVKANEPAVRNALLMLFAGKTREDVVTREGKETLRKETLNAVQEVIGPHTAPANVEDIYFTSLIAQ
jgi:flagellar protein FliL